MKGNLPSVSIIIPTYNAQGTLALCLKSIQEQNYPKDKLETIIIDASSRDDTLKIAKKFKVTKILSNPLITAEAGKSLGVKASANEIIALIDSDNILEGRDWLKRMVAPFEDAQIVGVEPLYYTHRRKDPLVVRYSALIGANDPICMYIGNYDRYNWLTDKWTELPVGSQDKGDYLKLTLKEENIPTIGANGFLVRKSMLTKTSYQPYLFDIDVVCELVEKGENKFAKVKIGIVHLFAKDIRTFIRKQRRRVQDYLHFKKERMRRYPWGRIHSKKIRKFVILTLFVFPLLFDVLRGYRKMKDRAWFFHIPACWLTLFIYGGARIRSRWFRKKVKIRSTPPAKKRVLILSPFFRPNVGGVETHLDDLCEYLRTHDHYVYVVTYQPITTKAKGKRIEKRKNLEIYRFPWIGYNLFHKLGPYLAVNFFYLISGLFFRTLFFLLRNRGRIDVIHAQGLSAAFITKVLAKMFNKKAIVSIHAIYSWKIDSFASCSAKWILSSFDHVLALSKRSKTELVSLGITENRIQVYTNWINQDLFRPLGKEKCKKSLGWKKRFVVLFVGRFIEIKGVNLLLKVAQKINPKIYFAFVGDGPLADKIKEASLKNKNVIYVGKVDTKKLSLCYNAADLVVIPSQYEEGFGRVILEALSCGTPVLGADKGGIPEAMDESVGVLINPVFKEIKGKIEFLYKHPEELKKLTQGCRNYALQHFSEENARIIQESYR
jgi:glycosyltransferase involved in cell wall biosynthesis